MPKGEGASNMRRPRVRSSRESDSSLTTPPTPPLQGGERVLVCEYFEGIVSDSALTSPEDNSHVSG
jgi:hypothetical protein